MPRYDLTVHSISATRGLPTWKSRSDEPGAAFPCGPSALGHFLRGGWCPGLITSNVDNDAGGIATYTQTGAHSGYALLWLLIPLTVALYVSEEMCARMGVVTGKGLSDLIREEFGFRPTFFVMLAALGVDLGNTVAEFAGVASALEIFHISKYISVPLAAIVVWALVLYGTYRMVEKIFLVACAFYGTYVISAAAGQARLAAGQGSILVLPPAHLGFRRFADHGARFGRDHDCAVAILLYLQAGFVRKESGLLANTSMPRWTCWSARSPA